FPTLADVAGAKLPEKVILDGRDFMPQLLGKTETWPREWIFVELGRHWFDREANWKLNEASNLFDMHGAPFTETLVLPDTTNREATAARQRLQTVLDQLNPAGGYVDQGKGDGKIPRQAKRAARRAARAAAGNPNASQNANGKND